MRSVGVVFPQGGGARRSTAPALDASGQLAEGPRPETTRGKGTTMKRFLVSAVALCAAAAWLGCGSSEESSPPPPTTATTAPPAARPTPPAAPKPPTEAQKQELLDLMVWGGSGAARDKMADANTCQDQLEADPTLQKGVHGLVKVQHWMQCMEKLGWARKQQG
jgi:hypothetical protein